MIGPAEPIRPDPDAIRTYADIIFDGLQGLVPVRMLPGRKGGAGRPKMPFLPVGPTLGEALVREAEHANTAALGFYVVPGTVAGQRARAVDVLQLSAVLVDLDAGDIPMKREHLMAHLGPASLDVASGGMTEEGHRKCHLYWRLDRVAEGADVAEVCRLRSELARKIGGDSHFGSAHQPIRVAGSVHNKGSSRRPVVILAADASRTSLADFARALDRMPPLDGNASDRPPVRLRATDIMTRRIREGGIDEVTRFQATSSVIGHWLCLASTGRISEDEAWRRVVEHNAAAIVPPWPEDRLRRDFDNLRRIEVEKRAKLLETPVALNEDALADRFSDTVGADWEYVAQWGRWLRWTGVIWAHDAEHQVRECIRQVCRKIAAQSPPHEARRLGAAKTFAAVERIARSDPRHARAADAWDRDPEALNTNGGIIDLRSGELLPHSRAARMTRIAAAAPAGGCPRWLAFLQEITGGDEEMSRYFARIAGYCLTGLTSEHVFFIFYGGGANGKSTLVAVLRGILGDYATSAPIETFVSGPGERHPTDLAGLAGARLVTAFETEEGRRWTESKIKAITGGDPVKARLMRQDFFEYTPQFKLIILGNHKPAIRSVDVAMRRRIQLVPFEVTIPPDRRQKDLAQSILRDESGGILNWALDGLIEWRRTGLAPPAAVARATELYFEEEDAVGDWLRERCFLEAGAFTCSAALFADWKRWADAAGEPPLTKSRLTRELSRRGITSSRTSRLRGVTGLRLDHQLPPVEAAE